MLRLLNVVSAAKYQYVNRSLAKWVAVFLLVHASFFASSWAADTPIRLAVGTFGLSPERRDGELADLIGAKLSVGPEFELVERRELNRVLTEASLGMSGLVRAKDAVRFGALLRADQFLLGSIFSITGTNRLIIRLVDARTGVIRAITVFRDSGSLENLAGEIAGYVRAESRRPAQGDRNFLAIGVIQNLGVNNRFPEFPAQMRGSVAATLGAKVTVLEREVISFLANEVRMDLAGLTEGEGKQSGQIQFGFWIVDGFYQSLEVAEPEVELKLRMERVPGAQQAFTLKGQPNEQYFTKIADTIAQAMSRTTQAGPVLSQSRQGEIEALQVRAQQLVDYQHLGTSRIFPRTISIRTAINPDKLANALDEATRIFESILLLDPQNNAAKMRLAGCLLYERAELPNNQRSRREDREARACDYLREVIATQDKEYIDDARITLALAVSGIEGINMLHESVISAVDRAQKDRFRYHRNELLVDVAYDTSVETVLPCLRNQLFDELSDLLNSTNEPARVSYDKVLFAYRFFPQKREKVINALLPELLEKFPKLGPQILLAAAGEQTTVDSPVIAQFLASLRICEENPGAVWRSSSYFTRLSSTLEEEEEVRKTGGCTLYQRTFDNRQFNTIVAVALARQRAAEKGMAPPLTALGKMRLAESYVALKKWKEALDLFEQLPDVSPQAKNECRRHLGQTIENEELPEAEWKDKSDIGKVELAYQCIERRQYSTALAILESIGHRTVRMNGGGPWGHAFTPVLPALVADDCRARAGKPPFKDPMRFELGETPYVKFTRGVPLRFSFEADGENLWIATHSQIRIFRAAVPFPETNRVEAYEFERATRSGNTSICVSGDYVWAGTADDGLLELDRNTKARRRLTMNDGLLLNGISGLKLHGNTLWIAYQNGANGAVGTLDLKTRRFSAQTPSLSQTAGTNSQPHYSQEKLDDHRAAPRLPISSMAWAEPGEMWFGVNEKGLQRFQVAAGRWSTIPELSGPDSFFPAMTADVTGGLLVLAKRETRVLSGEKSTSGGLMIYDYRQGKHSVLQIHQGLPSNDLSAVAVDGRIAWVGGRGFVAVVDLQDRKILRIAYVSASRIGGIQLGKLHAWIQLSCTERGDSDYAGKAWTGVYRIKRSAVEPAYTASRQ